MSKRRFGGILILGIFFLLGSVQFAGAFDAEKVKVGDTGKTVKELAVERTINVLNDLERDPTVEAPEIGRDNLVKVGEGHERHYQGMDYFFDDFWTYYDKTHDGGEGDLAFDDSVAVDGPDFSEGHSGPIIIEKSP